MDNEEAVYLRLKGKFRHYCYEWDDMAIDENCPEFAWCTCDWREQQAEVDNIKVGWEEL